MIGATLAIIIGMVCVGLFAYVNLYLQPLWFPNDLTAKEGSAPASGVAPASHAMVGVGMAILLLIGVTLMSLGSAVIATTIGYG